MYEQNKLAKAVLLFSFISIAYISSLGYYKMWERMVVGGGDAWGYYVYLPALFIHHDLPTLEETVKIRAKYEPGSVGYPGNPIGVGEALPSKETGRQVIKYTMGVALLELPFFLLAHAYVKVTGSFPADGFSKPYIMALYAAMFCFVLAGCILLWRVLRRFFSENTALATTAIIALATNLYYFTVYSGPMSHPFLFFFFALAIYGTVKWHDTLRPVHLLLTAIAAGFITLIRPVEIIVLFIPLLYGIRDKQSWQRKWALLNANRKTLALAVLAFVAIGLPQFLYWKWTSGHFFYDSYGEERFDFAHPKIWRGLFGYKNGWLAYTPVMLGSVAGLFLLWWRSKDWFWPIAAILPIHIYITYSWWCWNYINGFGARPMVDLYALLAIPLACFLEEMARRRWALALATIAILFCFWLNVFNTWQFSKGIMWSEDANRAYFWRMLGKTSMDYLDLVTYDSGEGQPRPEYIERHSSIWQEDFENTQDSAATSSTVHGGTRSYLLGPGRSYGQDRLLDVPPDTKPGDWVRVGVWANNTGYPASLYNMNVLYCEFLKEGKKTKARQIRIDSKLGNESNSIWGCTPEQWGEAYFWIKVPGGGRRPDQLKVIAINYNGVPVFLDDLSVEVWKRT